MESKIGRSNKSNIQIPSFGLTYPTVSVKVCWFFWWTSPPWKTAKVCWLPRSWTTPDSGPKCIQMQGQVCPETQKKITCHLNFVALKCFMQFHPWPSISIYVIHVQSSSSPKRSQKAATSRASPSPSRPPVGPRTAQLILHLNQVTRPAQLMAWGLIGMAIVMKWIMKPKIPETWNAPGSQTTKKHHFHIRLRWKDRRWSHQITKKKWTWNEIASRNTRYTCFRKMASVVNMFADLLYTVYICILFYHTPSLHFY